MRRSLIRSQMFVRAAKRLIKKSPNGAQSLRATLEMLEEDAYHPGLKTHKLKGELEGLWACTAGYGLRIIFCFVPLAGSEAILLQTVGTHEEID